MNFTSELKVVSNALMPQMYCELRQKCSDLFQPYAIADVEIALHNTLYSVVVFNEERPVGIARVVGDDRIVFFIKDVVVDPAYQHRSIGTMLMDSILDYIYEKACPSAYIGLMCTPNTEPFYEKFGFIRRPNEHHGYGMVKFVE
ncbi:GNAT family N-acetyltransferase [Paenibacillus sp. 1001270B_150601_E10]|uniref:GNAT family N-acetyltransferase n=1 Tax=Paenibacillus sp. 1001270B_150601_E10 TaxID=2787079 RepID=UPI00189E7475|nr:GNAT family N-acetyltransferase [Paenibacillus sp. 1001270B_150601_E10]